ncbi:hypothetical protein B296_00003868 [Ensete ventricosum]|uniref:Uncharacterized protein n=1 Tax=Ensete ventricosum TaxID=4639 RepID=A0A427BBL1_ENSVE|nr:hypothetical protein B296_00003868 [Ensete ventricosum]
MDNVSPLLSMGEIKSLEKIWAFFSIGTMEHEGEICLVETTPTPGPLGGFFTIYPTGSLSLISSLCFVAPCQVWISKGVVAPYMEPSAEEGLHLPQSLVAVDPCVDSLDPAWGPHIVTSSCEKATGGSSTPWGMGTTANGSPSSI